LKKARKNFYLNWTVLAKRPMAQIHKSFLRAFFQKSATFFAKKSQSRSLRFRITANITIVPQ
jgi:hypothetical protein